MLAICLDGLFDVGVREEGFSLLIIIYRLVLGLMTSLYPGEL